MSNAKIQAAQDLQRFMSMFSGLAMVAEDLINVGSYEQAAEQAAATLEDVKRKLQAALKELQQTREDKRCELFAASEAAKSMLENANTEAEKTLADAAKSAGEMLGKAHDDAKKMIAAAEEELVQLKREVASQHASMNTAKVDLADIKRDIDIANRERERLKEVMRQAKERLFFPVDESAS